MDIICLFITQCMRQKMTREWAPTDRSRFREKKSALTLSMSLVFIPSEVKATGEITSAWKLGETVSIQASFSDELNATDIFKDDEEFYHYSTG